MNTATDTQLQALLARLTSPHASAQLVDLPDQLNVNDPSKHAQTGLFEEPNAKPSNTLTADSRMVLACFGEVVVFQRIWVDVAGCFEHGVVLSHLLSAIQETGQKSEAVGFVNVEKFMRLTEYKTGIPYQDIEDALFVMDASKQLIVWQFKDVVAEHLIGINTQVLLNLLKAAVLYGGDTTSSLHTGVLG